MSRRPPRSGVDRRIAQREAARRYRERKAFAGFRCLDCGLCTFCSGDYYMVTEETWNSACQDAQGILCISCLENRLGRLLTRQDFIDAPVNALAVKSSSSALRAAMLRQSAEVQVPYIRVAPPAPPYCEHLPPRRRPRASTT